MKFTPFRIFSIIFHICLGKQPTFRNFRYFFVFVYQSVLSWKLLPLFHIQNFLPAENLFKRKLFMFLTLFQSFLRIGSFTFWVDSRLYTIFWTFNSYLNYCLHMILIQFLNFFYSTKTCALQWKAHSYVKKR